ncbi:hypothetical protein F183_A16910 [Bryobacterales bacterium F-183]|nr:hypothetical protein F183_A16910 [Bryobacterales bacterium F-183]
MKFKIDENLPVEVADLRRDGGFNVDTVHDERLIGEPDTSIALAVAAEGRILVTLDLDFADISRPPGLVAISAIVLRSKAQDKHSIIELARMLLPLLRQRTPERELWIVQKERIRIRPLA